MCITWTIALCALSCTLHLGLVDRVYSSSHHRIISNKYQSRNTFMFRRRFDNEKRKKSSTSRNCKSSTLQREWFCEQFSFLSFFSFVERKKSKCVVHRVRICRSRCSFFGFTSIHLLQIHVLTSTPWTNPTFVCAPAHISFCTVCTPRMFDMQQYICSNYPFIVKIKILLYGKCLH